MDKLAQDSYFKGVLDFLKTASIDPAIGETALDFLIKSASGNTGMRRQDQAADKRRARNQHQRQRRKTNPSVERMARNEQEALEAAMSREPKPTPPVTRTPAERLPPSAAPAPGPTVAQLEEQMAALRSSAAAEVRAEAARARELQQLLDRKATGFDNLRANYQDMGKELEAEINARRSLEGRNASLARNLSETERRLLEMESIRQAQMDAVQTARSELGTARTARAEIEAQLRAQQEAAMAAEQRASGLVGDVNKLRKSEESLLGQVKNLKGRQRLLAGPGALGLGYMGYDQLYGGGLGLRPEGYPANLG